MKKTLGMVGMFISGARHGALTYLAKIHHVSCRPKEHFAVEKNKQLYQIWISVNLKEDLAGDFSFWSFFHVATLFPWPLLPHPTSVKS